MSSRSSSFSKPESPTDPAHTVDIHRLIREIKNDPDANQARKEWARYAEESLPPSKRRKPDATMEPSATVDADDLFDRETMLFTRFERIRCTSTIQDYNVRFLDLMHKVRPSLLTPYYCAYRYRQGLPLYYKLNIIRSRDLDLDELMLAAQRVETAVGTDDLDALNDSSAYLNPPTMDQRREHHRPERSFSSRLSPPHNTAHRSPDHSHRHWPRATSRLPDKALDECFTPDAANVQRTWNLAPLDEEEREQLRKSGLCFRCRIGRHRQSECPQKGHNER